MAPRDDLPTPDEFAADRIPASPEVLPPPLSFYAPRFSMSVSKAASGQTSRDPAFGSASTGRVQAQGLGGTTTDPSHNSNTPADPNAVPSPFSEVGASGLAQYGGFVRDEFLPQLQGDRGLRVFREMYDNDPIVGALVFMIQMLMRKVEWRVEPPESNTVEGIVEARQKQREELVAEKNAEKQQQMMLAQAGVAGKAQGSSFTAQSPTGATIAGPGAPPQKPAMAQGTQEPSAPFHQPVPGLEGKTAPPGPTPHAPPADQGMGGSGAGAGPSNQPGPGQLPAANASTPASALHTTPPAAPGPNPQPNAATAPRTNAPATSNVPQGNPGGGPNQAGALQGHDGLPGAKPIRKQMEEVFERWWGEREHEVSKAGPSSGSAGGIDAIDVGGVPLDPETNEAMEFPMGTGPLDAVSPEERHAMELAVFVETALHDMCDSWADTISQIVTMIVYGFALHELVYKKRNGPNPDDPTQGSRFADGKIGWAKIAGRAQETRHRWEFDEFGNVLGMWQLAPPKFQLKYIPLSKALLFRTTGYKQNPEGRSILRSAYRPWYFKRRIEEIEAIGVERDLAGLPIAYVPYQMMSPYASTEEKAALNEVKTIVRNIRRDEQDGLVFPAAYDPDSHQPMFKFELLSSPSRRQFDTDKIITRYDQRIAMVALIDFILLGHETVGSKALADTKVDLFTTALESWLSVIADTFNSSAIPRLMQINGEDPAMAPRLTFGKLSRISLTEIAALITSMAGAGADLFPDTALEDFLREAGGLPSKSATDDL